MLMLKSPKKIIQLILEQLHVSFSLVKLIFIALMQEILEVFYQEVLKESLV